MIRERLERDLGTLVAVLGELDHPAARRTAPERRTWLVDRQVEVAWVFDQAPVTVVPTGNVVGHVSIHRPTRTAYDTGAAGTDVLAVAQLFVRPGAHQHGIARFLLTEAVAHVHRLGATAVLDLRDNVSLTPELARRRGFRPRNGPEGGDLHYLAPPG